MAMSWRECLNKTSEKVMLDRPTMPLFASDPQCHIPLKTSHGGELAVGFLPVAFAPFVRSSRIRFVKDQFAK
jgi:hypothetical protein